MRRLVIGHHHFAHHQGAVLARAVRIHRHRVQLAIGTPAFSLPRGTAVKAPDGQLGQLGEVVEFLDESFAAKVANRFIFC